MNKDKILEEVYNLVKEEGCMGEVLTTVTLAFTKYKGKQDEMLAALNLLSDKLIDRKTAKNMLKNEHTEGYLNLSLFPYFRNKIIKIAKIKY